jgi:hypothetical protein
MHKRKATGDRGRPPLLWPDYGGIEGDDREPGRWQGEAAGSPPRSPETLEECLTRCRQDHGQQEEQEHQHQNDLEALVPSLLASGSEWHQ